MSALPVATILPPLPPIPPAIAQIAAPLLIGTLINWFLYGILLIQVYFYHLSFSQDQRLIKCLVYGIFILETLEICLSGADIHYWFASGFGDMRYLGNPYLSPFGTPMLGSVIALIVQSYFCYRIWVFNKSAWLLPALIGAISIMQCVAGFLAGLEGHLRGTFVLDSNENLLLYLWLVGDALADTVIAISMVYLLMQRRKQEHRYTNTVLVRSVRLVVESNSMTAGLAIMALVFHAASRDTDLYIAPTLAIGKMYSNTLLVTFNNRHYLREAKPLSRILVRSESKSSPQTTPSRMGLSSDYSSRDELSTGHIIKDLEEAEGISLEKVNTKINTTQL